MKKLLKYLGFGFISIVIFVVGVGLLTTVNSVDKEKVFEPFISNAIPQLTTWDVSNYKKLMSEKGFAGATQEQWDLYLKKVARLGKFQSIGNFELLSVKTLSPIGSPNITYAVFQVPVIFDTGLAHVQLGLQLSEDKVEINSIKFLSDILMQ